MEADMHARYHLDVQKCDLFWHFEPQPTVPRILIQNERYRTVLRVFYLEFLYIYGNQGKKIPQYSTQLEIFFILGGTTVLF